MTSTRGAALVYATATALVTSIVVYGMLTMLVAQARQGRFSVERARARYAAEAGLVWAMKQLDSDPQFDFSPAPDVTVAGYDVDITLASCALPPCASQELKAKVTYAVL